MLNGSSVIMVGHMTSYFMYVFIADVLFLISIQNSKNTVMEIVD
ncbi:hypothetical protein NT01EI_2989 [Edwardsiella ictaluri 93-146]|uniref:Uncharacterized protein n=1 Tax=Edwardsiella ictaluri (strain 93-146) TaxID=634503 RepID=C5B8U0_EDWI9|nr:hypothetical protein NT01EI_2989 [Edwardsiella ictaluri 93-146]